MTLCCPRKLSSVTSLKRKTLSPRVFVPDLLARWPYPRRINPHHVTVMKESTAWMESFGAFSPKAQHAFNRGFFSHLGAMAYPIAKKEHLRACCDLMSLFFFADEYADASRPSEVQKQKDVIMDAFRNPHKPRPKGEWMGGEVARQFWQRTTRDSTKRFQKRFIMSFGGFLEALRQQAIDRSGYRIRDVKSYFDLRRDTIGAKPSFLMLQMALDIPDEIDSHPAVQEVILACADMVIMANDITSYNIEQAIGDVHNIVTIVMHELGTDVNGAMLWAQDHHIKAEQKFYTAMAALPKLDEPHRSQVKEYCDGIGNWVRANYNWHFESERYFGNRGSEIMESRWISLLPKRGGKPEVGPLLIDSSIM